MSRPQSPILGTRQAGVLLHPTSLPGPGPAGTLGHDAYYFVDFLVNTRQRVWQVLPLGPTHADGSPYQCLSVHAGSERLICWQQLVESGWLGADTLMRVGTDAPAALAAAALMDFRMHAPGPAQEELRHFCAGQSWWLEDYALYRVLRRHLGERPWFQWPVALRDRKPAALAEARQKYRAELEQVCFEQFLFQRQWLGLKRYANERGVRLFGDLPIFVAYDSVDVWVDRACFRLDAEGQPTVVAGVPPDYFSADGQRWGNPLYDWEHMAADGFAWWRARIRSQLHLFDLVRIDHFRGFEAFWEIPATERTAIRGRWVPGPGDALFDALEGEFGALPVVAEDLGTITPEVDELRRRHRLPGMRVLQFGFDGSPLNPHLPHNFERETVAYTGTHDNDTTCGWFESLDAGARRHVQEYLGSAEEMPWSLIRGAHASVAELAIVPMQDVLGLDGGHRMNRPGTSRGNWSWRFTWDLLTDDAAKKLRRITELYGRSA